MAKTSRERREQRRRARARRAAAPPEPYHHQPGTPLPVPIIQSAFRRPVAENSLGYHLARALDGLAGR